MKFKKRCNRYLVISSDYDRVPTGSILLDNRNDRIADWTVIDADSGTFRTFVARKVDKACPDCANRGHGAIAGHDGPHGTNAPKLPPISPSAN